jgi:hypothetical protein
MLTNIPVHDSRLNTFWTTHDTKWKFNRLTKSGTITLVTLDKFTSKTPGAQRYMLINIPV